MKSILFKQITQVISRTGFQKIVDRYDGDKHTKTFSSWQHLMVMLFAQLAGRTSLRDITHSLQSNRNCLHHMGIKKVSRNNLSYRNEHRDYRIFEGAYYMLRDQLLGLMKIKQVKNFKFKQELKAIDSTTIALCKSLYDWASFRKTKSGIKMHTVLDRRSNSPEFILITDAKVNDAKILDQIPIKRNCIYVQDRAYLCLKWLYAVVCAGSHFVIRLKSNVKYRTVSRNPVPEHLRKKGIIHDNIIRFTGSKTKDYPKPVRHIRYKDLETGQIYDYITDNLTFSAFTIAEIYRDRWEIELFFKKIKQNLKIKRFIGLSDNAVRIQIWAAMIVVLLYEWMKHLSQAHMGLKEFMSRIQLNIFSRKDVLQILSNRGDAKCGPPGNRAEKQLLLF
jgi:hypothetical protein